MTDTKSPRVSIADMLGTNPERIHSDDSAFLPSRRRRRTLDAEREIAALKAEIARLREGHRESFNVFDIMLELDIMTQRARYHRDRCKALAEGREP
jgi:hypothetical protein